MADTKHPFVIPSKKNACNNDHSHLIIRYNKGEIDLTKEQSNYEY